MGKALRPRLKAEPTGEVLGDETLSVCVFRCVRRRRREGQREKKATSDESESGKSTENGGRRENKAKNCEKNEPNRSQTCFRYSVAHSDRNEKQEGRKTSNEHERARESESKERHNGRKGTESERERFKTQLVVQKPLRHFFVRYFS